MGGISCVSRSLFLLQTTLSKNELLGVESDYYKENLGAIPFTQTRIYTARFKVILRAQ